MRYSKGVITPSTRDVTITVNDGTNAISGATVTIGTDEETTDEDGEATFTGLSDGVKSVQVSKTGYATKTQSCTVASDATAFTISLTAVRNISFTINDGTAAVEGAEVVLDEDTTNKKTTGSAGGCTFSNVEDGSHSVVITADGFEEKTQSITVSSDSASFTISLTASVTQEETPG